MTEPPAPAGGSPLGEIPRLRPHPGPALFERRAERLRALAPGHPMEAFLGLCAAIASAQGVASRALPAPSAPGRLDPGDAAVHGGAWAEAAGVLARELAGASMPEESRRGLARVAAMPRDELVATAGRIVALDFAGLDLAAALFATAAIQADLAALAPAADAAPAGGSDAACPVCGAPPVAGVVLGDGGLRYLACALCGSQWHVTRVRCARCRATGGLAYLALAGDPGEVKVEACAACRGYLKLFYLERRPAAEPTADDLATLALDHLVAEEGYARIGVNLFLPV